MPMHDWTRVEPHLYHHFHQQWAAAIADILNAGLLPTGFSALLERDADAVSADAPAADMQARGAVRRANRVSIRHRMGEVVCVIEIVSPGNKANGWAVGRFVDKTIEFLRAGVHVLLVDPFPPGTRDPHSLHKRIWDQFEDVPFDLPADEPLLQAAYRVRAADQGGDPVAYLEPFRVGAALTDMPAWIDPDEFVEVPLEAAYLAAWDASPADFRFLVEHGRLPDE